MNDESGRPLYETDDHLKRERAIVAKLEELWRMKAAKLPIRYQLDYAFVRDGQVAAFSELKSKRLRTLEEIDALGGVLIDLAKMERAASFQALTGLPFIFVVEFKDGVHAATFKAIGSTVWTAMVCGRADRGDWQDVEPALKIGGPAFHKLFDMDDVDGGAEGGET